MRGGFVAGVLVLQNDVVYGGNDQLMAIVRESLHHDTGVVRLLQGFRQDHQRRVAVNVRVIAGLRFVVFRERDDGKRILHVAQIVYDVDPERGKEGLVLLKRACHRQIVGRIPHRGDERVRHVERAVAVVVEIVQLRHNVRHLLRLRQERRHTRIVLYDIPHVKGKGPVERCAVPVGRKAVTIVFIHLAVAVYIHHRGSRKGVERVERPFALVHGVV